MSAIFLSYAGVDREIATQVALGLKGTGVDVWWDREGIGWGDNWIQKLEDALTQCTGYVILVGSSGVRKWVKFELSLAIKRHIEQELPIFPLLLPGVTPDALPPFLATLQAKPLPEKLSDIDYGNMATWLSRKVPYQDPLALPSVPSEVCPFPGLEAFGEDDAKFFFGRQKETLDAVSCMGMGLDGVYRRWLQVEGTSGVGKSSLVKAGIIPTIKKGWAGSTEAATWRGWRIVEPMRPGADPILNLSEALSKSLGQETGKPSLEECYGMLQHDDKALQVALRGWVPSGEALVLVIDQLEEIFTLTQDGKVRDRFDALLANALSDQDGPLHVVTTIRSDFMMRFTALPCLQALLHEKASRYLLTPIDNYGLKDVVFTPAKLAGLRWSDELLPDDIVKEARGEPGALPLVENLLRLLWLEAQSNKSETLSRKIYNELGGVGGALAKSADALLESLGDGKEKALNLLTALVNVGGERQDTQDTRRTVPKSVALKAAGGGAQAEEILDQLSGLRGRDTARGMPARPRLVVVSTGMLNGTLTDIVDLAHETLLRYNRNKEPYWGTLRKEITKRRKEIENRQLAEALAKDWRVSGSPRWSGLATRAQRKAFRGLRDLSGDAAAYVEESLRLAKRLGWSIAVVVVLLISSASFVTWARSHGAEPIMVAKFLLARVGLDVLSPAMQKIPAAKFEMGDIPANGRGEKHRLQVSIERPFAIGPYEVTFKEYDLFAAVTGKELPNDAGWGRGRRPVINVSWEDAKEYAQWLTEATGKRYRLPSEAEWEYAARSGGLDQIWAGTSDVSQLENYAVYDANRTAPVGTKKHNGLGLYDMSGNVWEWVQDCYLIEVGEDKCGQRVIRGGSWNLIPEFLRASNRTRNFADDRSYILGFRLAQDLP
jgi:formylglycine-generating enzyme required for sulfatase activity